MSDILCIYYSRTGNTKKAMEEIAAALDAELAELRLRHQLQWLSPLQRQVHFLRAVCCFDRRLRQ